MCFCARKASCWLGLRHTRARSFTTTSLVLRFADPSSLFTFSDHNDPVLQAAETIARGVHPVTTLVTTKFFMPSDGRYMYPHPPPNMSYDYGAYPPNTYDNPQYPPSQPGPPQRPPHPVNANSHSLSRVHSFIHYTFPSQHIRPIMARLPITSYHPSNSGMQPGHRILLLCIILLRLDSPHPSRCIPDQNRPRSSRLGKNPNGRSPNLRNPRKRNSPRRRRKCRPTEI